jgi:hypothetical protein
MATQAEMNAHIASAVKNRSELETRRQEIVDRAAADLAALARDDFAWQRFERGIMDPYTALREASELMAVAVRRIEDNAREQINADYIAQEYR